MTINNTQTGTPKLPAALDIDFYKTGHGEQLNQNTSMLYTNFMARSGKNSNIRYPYNNGVVFVGLQYYIKRYLINLWNETFFYLPKKQAINNIKRYIDNTLPVDSYSYERFEKLHDLGVLPLAIKALPEGSYVQYGIPMVTCRNNGGKDYVWLVNFIENSMSHDIWGMINSATTMREYQRICFEFALKTCDNTEHVKFQCHDFSNRGMFGSSAVEISGFGALAAGSVGTDSIPAIKFAEDYYCADVEKELVGTSIPATEHSVMCTNIHTIINSEGFDNIKIEFFDNLKSFGVDIETAKSSGDITDNLIAEYSYVKKLITEIYPTGKVSVVADSYDFWGFVKYILPALRPVILQRDGQLIIRPDSGDPVDIICGTIFSKIENYKEYYNTNDYVDRQIAERTILNQYSNIKNFGSITNEDLDRNVYLKTVYYMAGNGDVYAVDLEMNKDTEDVTIVKHELYEYTEIQECGLISALGFIFGSTLNDKGYKELNPKIGAIYGDSITMYRANQILTRLQEKKFASNNIVFGVGSYSFQGNSTRDTHSIAIKATYCEIEKEDGNTIKLNISKSPKTDAGKKSPKGLLMVIKNGDKYELKDECTPKEECRGCLETVFYNGVLTKEITLNEIRERVFEDLNEQLGIKNI